MKPLELTIYPHWTDEMSGRCYADREGLTFPINVDYWMQCKRLTDAELAAEVWRQEAQVTTVEAMGGTPVRNIAALKTLHRFATMAHYDEATL